MPVESPVTYISDLVVTNPVHGDGLAQADSHLRLIKSALKATFPNINGAVSAGQSDLTNGYVPIGGIIMWSGSVGTIPTNWHLCDGTSGTVDLRDRFVIGAGDTYAPAATGGSTSFSNVTSTDGAHTHASTATSSSTSSSTASATSSSSSSTDNQGAHSHAGASSGAHALDITEMPAHSHSVNTVGLGTAGSLEAIMLTGVNNGGELDTDIVGGGVAHSHSLTIPTDGGHTHSVTTSTTTNVTVGTTTSTTTSVTTPGSVDSNHAHALSLSGVLPPYYALAFIQRVS